MISNRRAIYSDGTPVLGVCDHCGYTAIPYGAQLCPQCQQSLAWFELPADCIWEEMPSASSVIDGDILKELALRFDDAEEDIPAIPLPVVEQNTASVAVNVSGATVPEVAIPAPEEVAPEAVIPAVEEVAPEAHISTTEEVVEPQPAKKKRKLFRKGKDKQEQQEQAGILTHCPKCGNPAADYVFCPVCGENLTPARREAELNKREVKHEMDRLTGTTAAATTNELAGFRAMFKDGIAESEPGVFSLSMEFSDISYEHERRDIKDDIFNKFSQLHASFPTDGAYQINLINFPITERAQQYFYDETGQTEKIARDANNILSQWQRVGRTEFLRKNYITFAVEAEDDDEAARLLSNMAETTHAHFQRLGSNTKTLDGLARAKLIHDLLCGNNEPFYLDWASLAKKRKDVVRNYVTPAWAAYPGDSEANYRSVLALPHKFSKTFFIRDFGTDLSDRAIRTIRALPIPMNISLLFRPRPKSESVKRIRENINVAQSEMFDYSAKVAKMGGDPTILPPAMEEKETEARELLDFIQDKDQNIAFFQGLITIWAPTREALDDYEAMIMAEKDVWSLDIIDMPQRQEQALVSSLPLATPLLAKCYRSLSNAESAAMIPFVSQSFTGDPHNSYLLGTLRATGQILFVDPDSLKSPHMWVFGITGGGKGMEMKTLLLSLLLQYPRTTFDPETGRWSNPSSRSPQIFTFDFHEEYVALGQEFNASITYFGPVHNSCLNPLNLSDASGELTLEDVHKNIDFFLALLEAMMDRPLTKREQSILDRNLNTVYMNHVGKDSRPTLLSLYDALRKDSSEVAMVLADSLEIFAVGSMSAFAQQTNIETSPQWNIYVMSELGNTMQTLVMLSALQHVRQCTYANHAVGKPTYLMVEECQKLFDNDAAVRVLMSYAAELRKYGLHLIFISQLPKTVLQHPLAEDLFENSGLFVFLPQQAQNAAIIGDMFKLSATQMEYIAAGQQPGTGLVIADGVKVAFKNEIPSDSYIYSIINTDPYRNAEGEWPTKNDEKDAA